MDLRLDGKVVMVAAASRGLGEAIARQAAAEGARVAIASSNREAIEAAAQLLRDSTGAEVLASTVDLRQPAQITAWAAEVEQRFGRVDGLLVNAGGPPPGGFDQFDDAAWQQAFELTLMSTVRLI
ncbi:MAG TPA: SDR family NAD(P)-dependent oxidoreductase, partial [Pseudomonadales bacterium]|nr:SDR family NAD(P)-dependent oxidoreductase [Pseudomonadales bacterium]